MSAPLGPMPPVSPALRVAVLSALREAGAGVDVTVAVTATKDSVTITRTVPSRSAADQDDAT